PERLVELRVRLRPGSPGLRFARRLLHVRDGALGLDRPGADEGLIEEVLRRPIGKIVPPMASVPLDPAAHDGAPARRVGGEQADPRADVLAALRVVRRGREEAPRPTPLPLLGAAMELRGVDAELVR